MSESERAESPLRVPADSVSWVTTDAGEIVILDLRSSAYLQLNPTAATLWSRLVDGASRSDLEKFMMEQYGLDRQAASADLEEFLQSLRSRDLLSL